MADNVERIVLEVDEKGAATAVASANKQVAALEVAFARAGQTAEQRLLAKIATLQQRMKGDPMRLKELDDLQQKVLSRMNERLSQVGHAATGAKTGISGMTDSLKQAAVQVASTYLSFQALKGVIKTAGVDTAIFSAQTETMGVALEAAARSNGVSVRLLEQQERALKANGIATREARTGLLKMVTAQMDANKATELARLAQNAAVVGLTSSSEAFQRLVYAIQSGQPEMLRTIGINVTFERSYAQAARAMGKTALQLTEYEKLQIRTNAVLAVAPQFAGLYEEAMGSVGKQMTSLQRHFDEARNAVGERFLPELRAVVSTLEDLLKLIQAHPELGSAITGIATIGMGAALAGAVGGPKAAAGAALIGTGVVAGQATKSAAATIADRIMELLGGESRGTIMAHADLLRTARRGMTPAFGGLQGNLLDEVEAARFATATEQFEKYMLSRGAEDRLKYQISKEEKVLSEAAEKKDVAGYRASTARLAALKAEEEQYKKLGSVVQKFLAEAAAFEEELSAATSKRFEGVLKSLPGLQGFGGTRAGSWAEQQLREFEFGSIQRGIGYRRVAPIASGGTTAETWGAFNEAMAEERKSINERAVAGLEREAELNEQLIRLRTGPGGERDAIEQTYGLRIRYAEQELAITQDRARYQERMDEAQIDRIREMAELERRRFDDIRNAVEDTIDAMITRSRSALQIIGGIFQAAILAPIKQAVAAWVAGMLMPVSGARGGAAGFAGTFGSAALGVGGLLSGAGAPGASGALGQLSPLLYPGAASVFGGGGGAFGGARAGGLLNLGAFAGMGSLLFNSGSIAMGGGMATTAAGIGGMGGTLAGIASSPAALLGGGMLAAYGVKRGGLMGSLMGIGGGALAGFAAGAMIGSIGGPLGMAIGAGIGGAAVLIRSLFKTAEEKARDKIQALYGVRIEDRGVLARIVEMAKGFGSLDVAIRSPQIRELVELYAATTGQRMPLQDKVRAVSLLGAGGSVYQAPMYENGSPYAFGGSLPTLGARPIDTVPAGRMVPTSVTIQLDGAATTQVLRGEVVTVMTDSPHVVSAAVTNSQRSSSGRRENSVMALHPSLVTG